MKKIYLLLIVTSFFAAKLNAQSFSLINLNNVLQGNTSSFQIEGTVDVVNNSGFDKNVMMFRKINNLAPGHESLFCWGINCYGSATDTSVYFEAMPSGGTSLARADLNTWNFPGVSYVTYCWYDSDDPSDSVCLEFTYNILPTGIAEHSNTSSDFVSLPHPNPADGSTVIIYHLKNQDADSKIVFYNVIGSKVLEVKLEGSKQNMQVNTSSFQEGVYYYSLISAGKAISTNKLIVSHKN